MEEWANRRWGERISKYGSLDGYEESFAGQLLSLYKIFPIPPMVKKQSLQLLCCWTEGWDLLMFSSWPALERD